MVRIFSSFGVILTLITKRLMCEFKDYPMWFSGTDKSYQTLEFLILHVLLYAINVNRLGGFYSLLYKIDLFSLHVIWKISIF